MSLRYTETNLHYTEASLSDCHTEHEPPLSIQYTSLYQKDFLKILFYVYKKRFEKISTQWQNSVTKDQNYLLNVMNSAFDYSLSGL